MRVPAIEVIQKNFPYLKGDEKPIETKLYVTALPLKFLENCYIDRRSPENPKGYQREPNEARITKDMVKYLTGEIGAYPTSVLINVRGKLQFTPEKSVGKCVTFGELEIPDDADLVIIDGQHRIESLKAARRIISGISDRWAEEISEYPLPVSILNVDREMEMVHFYIVNSRQKGVPTDLAFEILRDFVFRRGVPEEIAKALKSVVKPRELWKAKAMEITRLVNEDSRSPWRGRLQFVGEERREEHLAKAKTFAQSLKYLLRSRDSVFSNMDEYRVAQILIDYWSAIYEIYRQAFYEPGRFTIVGYTGLHAFHKLLPYVYSVCEKMGAVTKGTMEKVLSYLLKETPGHSDPEFREPIGISKWDKTTASLIFRSTNSKGIEELVERLKEKIELAMREEEQEST